jgi:hypothetical protein
MEETDEELISGKYIIPGNKFENFTNRFRYLGT